MLAKLGDNPKQNFLIKLLDKDSMHYKLSTKYSPKD